MNEKELHAMKVNIDDIEWQESNLDGFSSFRKQLGIKAGSEMLGASLFKLSPGCKAFPFHCHYANEEAILVLSGNGTLRIGDKKIQLTQNDYVTFLRGNSHPHQVINTSDAPLIYLCISTMIEPDVMQYPDSNKLGVMIGSPPGGGKNNKSVKAFFRIKNEVSYYDGEE